MFNKASKCWKIEKNGFKKIKACTALSIGKDQMKK